jgi:hypothetical protein
MTTYRVAVGADVALGSLTDLTPQPASDGLEYTRETIAADGSVYAEGPFIDLKWSMFGSISEYTTMLAQFGLDANRTQIVTVYIPNEFYAFARYNGIAVRPQKGRAGQRNNYFLRNFVVTIKNLVLST